MDFITQTLKVLEAATATIIAIFLGSGFLLLVQFHWQWIDLKELPWAVPILAITCAFSGFMTLIRSVIGAKTLAVNAMLDQKRSREEVERKQREIEENYQAALEKRAALNRFIDTLKGDEREIIAWLIQYNQQSLNAEMGHAAIGTLIQKGMIVMGSGVVGALDAPYTVPHHVWMALQERKSEFLNFRLGKRAPWIRNRY